ncbi:MAG: MBL fold metallo-hydrolase [Desulfomonilia bacterium]
MTSTAQLDSLKLTVIAEDSVMYESPYLGQHGISVLISAQRESRISNVLLDVGQNPEALLHNMKVLNVSPSCIDAIVLTHCHYDHTQGVSRILKETGKSDLPVIAHPDLFRPHFITTPAVRQIGVMQGDYPEDIQASGGTLYLSKDPVSLMPGLMTTGEVQRETDFEDVGMSLFTLVDGRVETDGMKDDISLVADVKGKGLVIVTGCSHAGIVNITRQAMKLTGSRKVHGILGGFHLIEAPDEKIRKTAEALKDIEPDWIAPGHCTGFRAQAVLYELFTTRFTPLNTGMICEV